jgi:hypothetical protein
MNAEADNGLPGAGRTDADNPVERLLLYREVWAEREEILRHNSSPTNYCRKS